MSESCMSCVEKDKEIVLLHRRILKLKSAKKWHCRYEGCSHAEEATDKVIF